MDISRKRHFWITYHTFFISKTQNMLNSLRNIFFNISYIKRYSRSLLFLDLLQYDFFRKGLEIPSFMANLKFLIEKDWIESSEIEKHTKNFYDSIVGSRDDFYLNGRSNDQDSNQSFNNDLNLNSNLMGLNRRSSI